jgi:CO/xanthine dehydrogenase Mo-binding subunit
MKTYIKSDGTPDGTTVVIDGKDVSEAVVGFSLTTKPDRIALSVELLDVDVERSTGEVIILKHHVCRECGRAEVKPT